MALWRRHCVALMFGTSLAVFAQPPDSPPISERQKALEAAVLLEGLIRLDVTVTGLDGKANADLKRTDFTLLDNGQPAKIAAFRAANSPIPPLERPTTVIILIDTLDLEPEFARFERQQIATFLRRNNGHLDFPVALYSLNNRGFCPTGKALT